MDDETELMGILDACELYLFPEDTVAESESDLMVDPYLNSLRALDPVRRC